MNKRASILLYQKNGNAFPLYIYSHFSPKITCLILLLLVRFLIFKDYQKEIYFTTRLLPLQSVALVYKLNHSLFLFFCKYVLPRLPAYKVVWMFDKDYYLLHNYLKWSFLVFDYDASYPEGDNFYPTVFEKRIVYIFQAESTATIPQLFYIRKGKSRGYVSQIRKLFDSLVK